MRDNKLGCFTGTGIFSALITLFVIVGIAFASGGSMFTAGDLNAHAGETMGGVTSHAQIPNCSACHTAPWETATMADRCVACHTDIAAQMMDVAKLHGVITHKSPNLACRDCHPEHRGPSAALTDLGDNVFPHEALGYSLNGHQLTALHKPFTCEDCHNGDITTFAPDTCQNCHAQMDIAFAQAHLLAYGTNCLACHDGVDRYGKNFDHNKLAFQLTGKHTDANCTGCHLDARSAADMQSTPKDCFSCHQKNDPHKGAYGNNCGACHSPEGWKPAKFDHNLSTFKLVGGHAEVKCEQCHVNNVFKGTPSDCYSCHQKDDEHNGQFGTDCSVCHTPSGWDVLAFDHNLAAFKLDGAHANVKCEQCHANNVFKGTPTDCYSCHKDKDEHNGQFGTDCSACHNTSNWGDATFDHNRAAFKLDGAHASVKCEQCHVNNVFKGTPSDCYSCHKDKDKHNGQFGVDCSACHSTSDWGNVTFDHNRTNFPLTGGHAGIACTQCHQNGQFAGTSTNCASCHADPAFHAGAFGTNCASCHSSSSWSPAGFNISHPEPRTEEGGSGINHGGAPSCKTCHPATVYQSTCTACHDGNPGEGGGDGHEGGGGD